MELGRWEKGKQSNSLFMYFVVVSSFLSNTIDPNIRLKNKPKILTSSMYPDTLKKNGNKDLNLNL